MKSENLEKVVEMEFDFADIKPSVANAIIIFLIVLIMVPVAKTVFNQYPIPGLTDLVNAI